MAQEVKTIGPSGQISLGKKHAGKTVIVEEVEEGVWWVKTALVIPENEMWLWQQPHKSRLDEAIKWVEEHPKRRATSDEEIGAMERSMLSTAKRKKRPA